jgi:hypothetical protein
MPGTILLPQIDGRLERYQLQVPTIWPQANKPFRSRIAYAAAHVVADPLLSSADPGSPVQLDWAATLAYRHYLWSLGFGVAEAMDTAQRGMGLDWVTAQELIRRTLTEAHSVGGVVACGAGTDQLILSSQSGLDRIVEAYLEQCALIEGLGGRVVLMASRALAASARSADDYAYVYGNVLAQVQQPVLIHWLGPMFDPQLIGYWGAHDLDTATETCLQIIAANATRIDGIKVSLLDAEREIAIRRRLPVGVRLYTGDDFNYPWLIAGDEQGYSDALLGIFDPIAPVAAAAFHALDGGDRVSYERLLEPTVPLSRHIFQAPTQFYKTGIVFLAYLNGHQSHFRMVCGQESARSLLHLAELFRLADRAGLLHDSERACRRMKALLALAGLDEG